MHYLHSTTDQSHLKFSFLILLYIININISIIINVNYFKHCMFDIALHV